MLQLLLLLIALTFSIYGITTHSAIWLIIATLGMGVAASGILHPTIHDDQERLRNILQRWVGAQWQIILYFALSLSMVSSIIVYYAPLTRLSALPWLAALSLLLVAMWLQEQPKPLYWLKQSWQTSLNHANWNRLDWLLIVLLGAVAFGLRIYLLDEAFPPAREDEGFQGLLTLQARYGFQPDTGYEPLPLFGAGWFGHPTLFYFLQAGAMAVFGESLVGMRMLSVIIGAACAPTMYILGKLGWGRIAGFSAGWLLAVSHFHIQYSRMALQNIETVWLMIILACCLLMAYRDLHKESPANQRVTWFILAGLAVGINQYFYVGARFAFILVTPLLLLLFIQRKVKVRQLVVFALVVIIVLLPQLTFYAQHPEHLTIRSQGVNIFSEENVQRALGSEATLDKDWSKLVVKQVQDHWRFWFDRGDTSPFYWGGVPAFDPVTVVLFWLGLGFIATRFFRYPDLLAGVWWGLGALSAGIFTLNPTWGARLVVITPSMVLIAGVLVQEVLNTLQPIWPRNTLQTGAFIFGVLSLTTTFYLNFTTYFVQYAVERPGLDLITVAKPMAAHPDHIVYLLGSSTDVNQGVIRFVARKTEKYDISTVNQVDELLSHIPTARKILFVAQPPRQADLTLIEERLPNGVRQTYTDPKGEISLITYAVPSFVQMGATGEAGDSSTATVATEDSKDVPTSANSIKELPAGSPTATKSFTPPLWNSPLAPPQSSELTED